MTASEKGNEGFDVERSTDGQRWSKIGYVRGNGDSNVSIQYSYLDEKPSNGANYYRLKQNDFDGNFEYSNTVALDFKNQKEEFTVFPILAQDVLYIDIDQGIENIEIQLLDTNGKVIWRNIGWVQNIPLSEISSGMYLLRVKSSSFEAIKTILKK